MAGPRPVRRNATIDPCSDCGGRHEGVTMYAAAGQPETFSCPSDATADTEPLTAAVEPLTAVDTATVGADSEFDESEPTPADSFVFSATSTTD